MIVCYTKFKEVMIMYNLNMPIIEKTDGKLQTIKKLFKEILGYTDEEIEVFIEKDFMCAVVQNITLEQAKQISEIFADNGINMYLSKSGNDIPIFWVKDLGISLMRNPPKSYYCDKPLISRNHVVDPSNQKEVESYSAIKRQRANGIITKSETPIITCPYCKSTNTKKISGLSKAVGVGLFGIFALGKTTKQFHCNNCNADF